MNEAQEISEALAFYVTGEDIQEAILDILLQEVKHD